MQTNNGDYDKLNDIVYPSVLGRKRGGLHYSEIYLHFRIRLHLVPFKDFKKS
jgi:hypothetical protein